MTNGGTDTIENLLRSGQTYVGVPFGTSMWPMLRNKRDVVVIEPLQPDAELAEGDVAVFKRGDRLVLHRIVQVLPAGYLFWGDNCVSADGVVPRDQVIGILTEYFRDGREMSLDDAGYHAYVAAWSALRPARCAWKKARAKAGRIVRGIARPEGQRSEGQR